MAPWSERAMSGIGPRLDGLRILVVEDEFLIAHQIEETLTKVGCEVVGPAAGLDKAVRLACEEELDGAILDVNLQGEMVYPVAERLQARQIPFIFATGYSRPHLPEGYRDAPQLSKPFRPGALLGMIRSEFPSA